MLARAEARTRSDVRLEASCGFVQAHYDSRDVLNRAVGRLTGIMKSIGLSNYPDWTFLNRHDLVEEFKRRAK